MAVTLHQLLKTMVERGGSDLHVTTNSGGAVSLAWTAVSGTVSGYVVEAGTRASSADVTTIDVGVRTLYDFSQVKPGTYYVRVRGRNACGTGAPSKETVVVAR